MDIMLREACNNATEYPKNLLSAHAYGYHLQLLHKRFQSRKVALFSTDEAVFLWEKRCADHPTADKFKLTSHDLVRQHLGLDAARPEQDPLSRFIFIHARDSLSPLLVTFETLSTILTFHQVMPQFVDVLFSFGKQETNHDFHHVSFFAQSPLLGNGSRPHIPTLGRSTSTLQVCYNLRAPEKHVFQSNWPWSLRQVAAYHSFDLENGRSVTMIIKANDLLLKRISSSTDVLPCTSSNCDEKFKFGASLAASFGAHLMLCHWAVEEWRCYVNFLEEQLQEHTGKGLYVMADGDSKALDDWAKSVEAEPTPNTMLGRMTTGLSLRTQTFHSNQAVVPTVKSQRLNGSDFAFEKLQRTQDIGDRTNGALVILKANAEVLVALKSHYRDLSHAKLGFLASAECDEHITRFERQVNELERILRTEQARVEMLARLIDDRKHLLYGLLGHQNMEASKQSSRNMEEITVEMHEIARKTQQDTVSMRIITIITLIFLPGTFISTIMSTDIVSWSSDPPYGHLTKVVSVGALKFFMTLTVPLIILTLAAWTAFYCYESQKLNKVRKKRSMPCV